MKSTLTFWPLFVALLIFLGAIFMVAVAATSLTDGKIIYTLDDTYIHMAMAKNIALNGIYGVTPHGFSASSSSPLWTFLLASFYSIFGLNEAAPGMLNIVFAVLCIVLTFYILRSFNISGWLSFVWLLLFIFFTPLPVLVSTGMEHTLHLLLSIGVLYIAGEIISGKRSAVWKAALFLSGALCVATRYEGMFLIVAISLYFAANNKLRLSVLFFAACLIPICLMGFFQMANGWYFIPNSVLAKGVNKTKDSLSSNPLSRLYSASHLFALVVIAVCQLINRFGKERFLAGSRQMWLFCFIVSSVFHCFFASTGWFFRYEAYLLGLGVLAIGINRPIDLLGKNKGASNKKPFLSRVMGYGFISFLMLILIFPLVRRSVDSYIQIPKASKNIYEQQYQMGLFLKQYYEDKVVVANDIGAISYMADIKLVDLVGLGIKEPVDRRIAVNVSKIKKKIFKETPKKLDLLGSKEFGEYLANEYNADIAVIYDSWFTNGVPSSWVKVGEWEIQNNFVCRDTVVSFYAINLKERNYLEKSLDEFSSQLPKDVIQRYE